MAAVPRSVPARACLAAIMRLMVEHMPSPSIVAFESVASPIAVNQRLIERCLRKTGDEIAQMRVFGHAGDLKADQIGVRIVQVEARGVRPSIRRARPGQQPGCGSTWHEASRRPGAGRADIRSRSTAHRLDRGVGWPMHYSARGSRNNRWALWRSRCNGIFPILADRAPIHMALPSAGETRQNVGRWTRSRSARRVRETHAVSPGSMSRPGARHTPGCCRPRILSGYPSAGARSAGAWRSCASPATCVLRSMPRA